MLLHDGIGKHIRLMASSGRSDCIKEIAREGKNGRTGRCRLRVVVAVVGRRALQLVDQRPRDWCERMCV